MQDTTASETRTIERARRAAAGVLVLWAVVLACAESLGPADPGDSGGPGEPGATGEPAGSPAPWGPDAIGVPFSEASLRSGALGGKTLHCSGPLHVPAEYEEYVAAYADRPPAMWVHYYSLLDVRFTTPEKLAVLDDQLGEYGGIPFLGISYTRQNPDGTSTGWDPQVAAGDFDDELRQIASRVAADGRPHFVRPGFEFNGAWNNYQPDSYRAAFIRIRQLFLEEGATNAIWVWNAHPAGSVAPYMEFYPGDEHVDWWGINLFGQAFDAPSQQAFTADFIAEARARGKPILLPESIPHKFHPLDDPATWDAWFVPYFDLIRSEGIGAFCYSNRDYTKVPAWSDWGDLRIEKSPLADEWGATLAGEWVVHGS